MGNEVVSKKTVAQFVHDAVEMETAIYTLEQMMDLCSKMERSIVYDAEHRIMESEKDLSKLEKELYYKNNYRKEENSFFGKVGNFFDNVFSTIEEVWDCYLKWTLTGLWAGAIPLCIILAIIFVIAGISFDTYYIVLQILGGLAGIAVLIVPIILYVIFFKQTTDVDKSLQISRDNEYTELKKSVDLARLQLVNSKKSYEQAKINSELLDRQWQEMCDKKTSIEVNLEELYSYGIIPEDYQYFDCVMILDQIFRNDLADTMREAIKIYEERVFRGSVIRGMDKICSMLGKLSSDMSAISLRLDMIDSNVSRMSDDLYSYNQRLVTESAKNRAATEELIKETQLGRYTNEKLLESNKRLEYYAEEYRMGRMPRY